VPSITVPLDTTDDAIELLGGKARSLARLIRAGFNVPGGFVVTTAGYRSLVGEAGLQQEILARARPAVVAGRVSFERASEDIGSFLAEAPMPQQVGEAIAVAYAELPDDVPVAVRSSATAEDLPELSFAGQQDTYLNVSGESEVIDAVRKCWASLWSAEAMSYRHENDIDQADVAMAVVVQRMVASDVSGILFTANPASGERDQMIVNASFGLGEAVVSGQVTPDTFVLERDGLAVTEAMVGAKERRIVATSGQGTVVEDVGAGDRDRECLTREELGGLTAQAVRVEELFDGVPQDIEWALAEGDLWLLQSRPITNLPLPRLKNVDWPEIPGAQLLKRQVAENMPDPLSPLFEDLYLRAIYDTQIWPEGWEWQGRLTKNWMKNFVVTTVNGYAYQPIYFDSGKDWSQHMTKHREEQVGLSWYANLKRAFSMHDFFIEDMKGGPLHPIYLIARAFRTFRKYPALVVWETRQLPEYLAAIERWESRDLSAQSDAEILEGMLALTNAEAKYWHALRSVIGTAKITDGGFQTFLEENAPEEGFISGTFLSGFVSRTLDAEFALRAIADRIREDPDLYELTIVTPAHRLLAALREHAPAADLVGAIEAHLHEYGRQVFNLDFAEPSLAEQPTPFMMSLKALVRDSGYDLSERQAQVKKTRRAKLLAALKFFKGKQRFEFLRRYWTARVNYPTREEALFYMGLAWSTFRPWALELGRRLEDADFLSAADDVFYLTRDELSEAIDARAGNTATPRFKRTAEEQRELRALRFRMDQPSAIPPIKDDKSPLATIRNNMDDANELRGFAVSPGAVTGVASVIMSPDEFDKMQPGSILVCPLTTPAWTQLFPHASGLVTDIGSILAHGSIVAREYGIPAVLGIGDATQRIKHGQTIIVDGDRGTVALGD
jgi:pyruvate,water dikinase